MFDYLQQIIFDCWYETGQEPRFLELKSHTFTTLYKAWIQK